MKLKLAALSALAMLVSACATAIPPHKALPSEARGQFSATDIVLPVRQSEIYIFVAPSQTAMYGGGGLLLALIDAGIDSSNAGTAEEAIKPLRNALVDYSFDTQMQAELQAVFSQSTWLNAGNYQVVREVTNANLDSILAASKSSAVLFVTMDYNVNWSGDIVNVNMTTHLFPKSAELSAMIEKPETSGAKTQSVNALYRNTMTFRDRAPNATGARETNLVIWEADNGARMRESLSGGARVLAELLMADLHQPLPPIDEKTTTLPKIAVDGLQGYIVKTDDRGTLVQFAIGTQMYITKAALASLPPAEARKVNKDAQQASSH